VDTLYAKSGDLQIAYEVSGSGERDLLLMSEWVLSMHAYEDEPRASLFLRRLESFTRCIRFDRRGVGLSDPLPTDAPPTTEQWAEDALAVLDAVGTESAALLCLDAVGGFVALLLAAAHPERVSALVLVGAAARLAADETMPFGLTAEAEAEREAAIEQAWGKVFPIELLAPSAAGDSRFRDWVVQSQRRGASPATALKFQRMFYETDLREALNTITSPTLVVHRSGNKLVPVEHGRYLAGVIRGARYIELPGDDAIAYVGDSEKLLAEIEEFLTGVPSASAADRLLTTVVMTDIVGSTDRAVEIGDRRWSELLEVHNTIVRRQLVAYRGREVNTTGDGFLAMFDGPARAVLCATAIRDAVRDIGLRVRVGVHTGEVQLVGDTVRGIAVHIGARVAELASADEILVSRTVTDLVAGSGLNFADRGEHALKGVPGTWRLYAVSPSSGNAS
jgi:pimeloyl-ACP methyl ester carboxylesterase